MGKNNLISRIILKTLSDDEIEILLESIPREDLTKFVKSKSRMFKKETDGFRINSKSDGFIKKIKKTFLSKIKENDSMITKFVESKVKNIVNRIECELNKEKINEEYSTKKLEDINMEEFRNLIEKMFSIPEFKRLNKNLKLYFKLKNYKLTELQEEYINEELPKRILEVEIREKVKNELEREYETKLIEDKRKFENKIKGLQEKIKEKEYEIYNLKDNIIKKDNEIIKYENKHKKALEKEKEIERLSIKLDEKSILYRKELEINRSLNNKLKLKSNELKKLFYEEWEIENKNLLDENKSLTTENEELEQDWNKLMDELMNYDKEKKELEEKIYSWNKLVENYINNIDENIIKNTLDNSLLKHNAISQKENKETSLYIKKSIKKENIEECKKIDDFLKNIVQNLRTIGLKSNSSSKISKYIIATIASGLTPLIIGYKSREIAKAISFAYSGETPHIITVTNGYNNSNELVDLYNNINSSVFLIEDSIGTMNENSLLPLLRERLEEGISNKLLLLSVEDSSYIKYIPESFYNYIALVFFNESYKAKGETYVYSDAKKLLRDFSEEIDSKEEHRIVKRIFKGLGFSKTFISLRSRLISYVKEVSCRNEAFNVYAELELKLLCSTKNIYDNIEKNISENAGCFDQEFKNIIKGDCNG